MKLNYRAPVLGLLVALAACGTESEGPMSVSPQLAQLTGDGLTNPASITVCKTSYYNVFPEKYAIDYPGETYVEELIGSGETFAFEIDGDALFAPLEAGTWSSMAGINRPTAPADRVDCSTVYAEQGSDVTIAELLEPDQALKKVTVYNNVLGLLNGDPSGTYAPWSAAGLSVADAEATAGTEQSFDLTLTPGRTWIVYFKNIAIDAPDEETGMEGCTPGYWGRPQHLDSWPATGFAPTDDAATVFGVDLTGTEADGWTLLDAVNQRGNGNSVGQLIRHATAALLNASHPDVDYPMTGADIIAAFQAAYASGEYETQKDMFADYNELGCDLN